MIDRPDIHCPYCGAGQEINHDDGYGYAEDETFEQECVSCDQTFRFTTSISFHYTAYCSGPHDWQPWAPGHPGMEGCSRCEAARRVRE